MIDVPSISIIIPCYNEGANLEQLFSKLSRAFSGRKDVEIILVNNGSTDQSATFMKQLISKEHGRLNIVQVNIEKNIGYGNGIIQGLDKAKGNLLSWTHADLQTDPADVLRGFEIYNNSDPQTIVKGKRVGRKLLEKFFSLGLEIVAWMRTSTYVHEVNAQPKIFPRSYFEKIKSLTPPPLDFSLDLYLLIMARRLNYHIVQFPVHFSKRLHGEAKGGGGLKSRIKLIKRTLSYIMKLKLPQV